MSFYATILYYNCNMIYRVLEEKTTIESKYLGNYIYNYLDTSFEIPEGMVVDLVEITDDYIARPDLVSIKAYNDDSYTDIICKLNGISNPFELNAGDVLVLPSFADLNRFIVHPNAEEKEDSDNTNVPVSKKKNEKRKANEAVVGDKRFSIDKNKRVVVY